jgi:hypothetical protein
MKAMIIGGYPNLLGRTISVFYDLPCEINGVEERIFRAMPAIMIDGLEAYFREMHLMFLDDGETVKTKIELDLNKVQDVEVEGIDTKDYPDFCDAYIAYATYDGVPMTDEQLEALNDQRDFVYEHVMRRVY